MVIFELEVSMVHFLLQKFVIFCFEVLRLCLTKQVLT